VLVKLQVIVQEKKKIKKGKIKMNKYQIEIVETLSRVIDIEANSYEDALEKVKEKYDETFKKYLNECQDLEELMNYD
jgi:hypothetical protein